MKSKIGYFYILLAGIFWSTLGFLVSKINDYNFSSEEVAFFRMVGGFIAISIYGKITMPTMFKITKKGIIYVLSIGIVCQFIFNISYMSSITMVGASMAAVLLYVSPVFVAIFSKIIYKEKINKIKILSLVFCVIGAFLAVTGGKIQLEGLNLMGVFAGIMAAITYAMLPIFNKNALKEMDNITMSAYAFLIAAIIMCFRINPIETISKIDNMRVFGYIVAIGVIPTAMSYIVYSKGILKGVELSIAGVVASIELVLSVIIGWTLLGEDFSFVKMCGVLFMVLSTFIAVKAIEEVEENKEINSSTVAEVATDSQK
ncbi:MAG: DMT family transporter [Intestinibacter bartlettii]|uniref:DMT family transporter n=1 Tax=Intestinibacter bartlettii TaxID=261299 RepID=UPI0026F1EE15|nr:DMT family transporter [Intestinibacter bartlettii]MDO5009587.1 DMT family transporter [Intestinibacter bartlettii]